MQLVQTRKRVIEHNKLWNAAIAQAKAEDKDTEAKSLRRFLWNEARVIRDNVEWLLAILYVPNKAIGCRVADYSIRRWAPGAEREAINWGDLGVVTVRRLGEGGWLVDIEEASPDCPQLCAYIAGWLRKWGWEAEVRTEW